MGSAMEGKEEKGERKGMGEWRADEKGWERDGRVGRGRKGEGAGWEGGGERDEEAKEMKEIWVLRL